MGHGGELLGWISTFWEQGMEEGEWLVFQDRRFARVDDEGRRSWDREGMHVLGPGDRLQIRDSAGVVLWDGVIEDRRVGLVEDPVGMILGHRTMVPADVEESIWGAWFHREPPLEASYWPATRG